MNDAQLDDALRLAHETIRACDNGQPVSAERAEALARTVLALVGEVEKDKAAEARGAERAMSACKSACSVISNACDDGNDDAGRIAARACANAIQQIAQAEKAKAAR